MEKNNGKNADCAVTSVLQTNCGRMFFAKQKKMSTPECSPHEKNFIQKKTQKINRTNALGFLCLAS
jgi:hypothetical protein